MNFQDYIRYDAVGLAELIRKKEVSADEVLQAALNRLDEVNPKLNLLAHDLRERAAAWQGSSEMPIRRWRAYRFCSKTCWRIGKARRHGRVRV